MKGEEYRVDWEGGKKVLHIDTEQLGGVGCKEMLDIGKRDWITARVGNAKGMVKGGFKYTLYC